MQDLLENFTSKTIFRIMEVKCEVEVNAVAEHLMPKHKVLLPENQRPKLADVLRANAQKNAEINQVVNYALENSGLKHTFEDFSPYGRFVCGDE